MSATLTQKVIEKGRMKLAAGGTITVDRPINVDGRLQINGSKTRPTIVNRQSAEFAPTFAVRDGDELTLTDIILQQADWPVSNRAIDVDGGKVTLINVGIKAGDGVRVSRCDSFTMRWGGSELWKLAGEVRATYHYALYLGGNMHDAYELQRKKASYSWTRVDRADWLARNVLIEDAEFQCGRQETGVRLMGAEATFNRVAFFVAPDLARPAKDRHRKQSFQGRHGRFVMNECLFGGSNVIGGLVPSIDNGAHAAYGAKFPTWCLLNGCATEGWLEVSGNTNLLIDGSRVSGKDPRGIGPGFGIDVKAWSGGTPRIILTETDVGHWTLAGVKHLYIGPGVTRGDKLIKPTGNYTDEIKRIREEAATRN
jgi:hypothetical protein